MGNREAEQEGNREQEEDDGTQDEAEFVHHFLSVIPGRGR
jgi:hypothetical protein